VSNNDGDLGMRAAQDCTDLLPFSVIGRTVFAAGPTLLWQLFYDFELQK
jgi:hypothetical protein